MKFYRYILTSVLIFFVFSTAEAQNQFNDNFLDAVRSYSNGEYATALKRFESILAQEPDNDAAWYYKGVCEMSVGREDAGEISLKKATVLDSTNYWYRDRLAMAYSVRGKVKEALAEYEKITTQYPKKLEPYYTLTNLYLSTGDYSNAINTLNSIEELSGKSDGTVLTKYRIYLQLQKQEEALEELKKYSEEYSSPQVLAMLGDHELGLSRDSVALNYYREALSLDSSYSPAMLGIAEYYRLNRNFPEFFEQLETIISNEAVEIGAKTDYLTQLLRHVDARFIQSNKAQLNKCHNTLASTHPDDSTALRTAGIYFFNAGDREDADRLFRANIENYPHSFDITRDYLEFLALTEDYQSLVRECDRALNLFGDNESIFNMAVVADYNLHNLQSVIARSEERIRKAPKDSAVCLNAYSTIGDIYHEMGENAKAYKAYEKALRINPDYAPVLNNYAYFLSLEGKMLGKAYKMSKKTVEQEPDNVTYLDTFGWILHLQGKDIEAKPFFKHAMLYGGKEDATVLAHYALVLENLGETDLAKSYKAQAQAKAQENKQDR